jgi:endoglucanase
MAKDDTVVTLLKDLIRLPGLSGHEGPAQQRIRESWRPLVDELSLSRLGSLHGLKRGTGKTPRPSVLIAAHMDAIGMMVSMLDHGFLRVAEIGGLEPRVLPGQPVVVHGRRDLPGLIVQPPVDGLPEAVRNQPIPVKYLLVDVGLPPNQAERLVRPGDLVSFAQEPFEQGDDRLVGHSLDNRASVAALTACLLELQQRTHVWDLWAVATAQEEETLGGALTSAFALKPSVAVAVDVTWARAPGLPEHRTFPLGEGPTNAWGPNVHPGVHKALKEAAARVEVPLATEPLPAHSGTDAFALQIAGEGIPTGVIGIPLLNMHTPVETVSIADIRRTGRLLAEFVAGLAADFAQSLTLD